MLMLLNSSRNAMLEALRIAHNNGMLSEIKFVEDILCLTEEELFNYFIIVLARTIK